MTKNPPTYQDEQKRISALMRYRDLKLSEEPEFKSITELAADICETPVALVSFVDVSDAHLKFACGLEGVSSVPRDISFCHYTVMGTEPLIVEDATLDARFKNSPIVTDKPKFRFYAGLPIVTPDGYVIGALCALDYKPNNLNSFQINSLQKLSKVVSKFLESKLLESEKREQETHSRLFFKHAPICIHGIDLNGCFTSMNPSGLDMLGLKFESQVRGTSYLSGVAENDYDRIKHLLEKALQGKESTFEFTGTSGNIYSSCFVPIKNLQGKVTKLMGISENITERIEAEKKHKELQDALNHVSRLSHINEMATGLAHEINQPLTALSHYCDAANNLLSSENIDKNKLSIIFKGISDQTHRAGVIVRHCRQIIGKQTVEKIPVNLNDLTKETVDFLDTDAQSYKTVVQLKLDENIPSIEIDKVQIQQVLVNLIRNGLEAMNDNMNDNKPRKITVSTSLDKGNNKNLSVRVSVQDTGRGLELSQIDNLFQLFFTTKVTGMGLGLSISRSIIEKHGGKLWLDTDHKPETLFHFTIPTNPN